LGMVPHPGRLSAGSILLGGKELAGLRQSEWGAIRGRDIGVVFQDPMAALSPVHTVGAQMIEGLRRHEKMSKARALDRAAELLDLVGVPNARSRLGDYPHQFSGGMAQRAMIAAALACSPKLLIADEPTTALDATVQKQVLDLILRLRESLGMSVLFITHDLGVIAKMAQRVLVMYAGVVVEEADVASLFARPLHPYTQGLLRSIPHASKSVPRGGRLQTIKGMVPNLLELPKGCRFSDRCPAVHEPCRKWEPPLAAPQDGSAGKVRCWLHARPPQ
ncbi:ABC transporter ATP-binding protein, partial [Rhizobiaceae sp. 2RAB30]